MGLGSASVGADPVPNHRFTAFDGLPGERITALAQTPNGLLWIGSETGLTTYDGHAFREIPLPDSIGTPYVSAIEALPDGSVWVAASRGQVVHVRPSGVERVVNLDFQFVWQILERNGAVLFVTASAVWTLKEGAEAATARPFQYEGEAGTDDRGIVGADLGPQGRLWVVHPLRGPGRVAPDGTVSFLRASRASPGAAWAEIRFTSDETAVALRGETVYRIDLNTGELTPLVEALGTPTYLTVQGTVAYATRNQTLLRYDVSAGRMRRPLGPNQGLPETIPSAVLRGVEGGLWVGTHDGLLYLRAPEARLLGTVAGNPVKDVMQFTGGSGAIWAYTHGSGLVRMPPARRLVQPDGLAQWREVESRGDPLHAIATDTEEWYRWRPATGWERVRSVEGAVTGLVESAGFVTSGGEGVFKRADGLYRYLPRPGAPPTRLVGWPDSLNYEHNVAAAPNGDIIHRAGGIIYRRTPDGTIQDTIGRIPDNAEPGDETLAVTPQSNMRHMAVDEAGRVWGAFSYDGGLLRVDPAAGTQRVLLKDQRVWRADVAGDSLVFATTRNNGLYVVDARNGIVRRHLTGADGLKSTTAMAAHLTDDTLYVGHSNGITRLPSEVIRRSPRAPESLITEFEVGFEKRPLSADTLGPEDDRTVAFSYTGISLKYARRVQYEVRLRPRDTAWKTTTRRFTRYTNLEPGTYRFEVRARLGNQQPTSVTAHSFTILPRFYETVWFRLLLGLGVFGLVLGVYRWRTVRLRRRKEELEAAVDDRTRQLQARTEELAEAKEQTERQAERLAELDEAKNRFFAHISHEFRTPLSLILSPLRDALQRASEGAARLSANQLRRMTQNAERLQRLIDQLLDLATLEAGRMELDRRPGDLAMIVERSAEAFRSKAEQKEITLRVERPEARIETQFDPEKVETIVSNLVGNAVKFTPDGGRVTVRIEEIEPTAPVEAPEAGESPQGTARITVEDTGPGIDPAVQETIFDRFEQADNSTTREHEGTGLGLALTSELVELHGGTIEVDSVPGEGTTFAVRLPVVPVAASGVEARERGSGGDGARGSSGEGEHGSEGEEERGGVGARGSGDGEDETRRWGDAERRSKGDGFVASESETEESAGKEAATILIVEDNAEMRAYLREQFAGTWTVIEAADGAEGWERVREDEPDLVLSDVMMPSVDGYELCRRIKADEDLRTIPVLLLTARAGEEATREGLQCGADDYVEKPFDAEELRQRIENHLAARRHLQARYREEVDLGAAVVEEEHRPFMEQLIAVIDEHLGNPDLTIGDLAEEMALSRRQLTRRVKRATGESPGAFLRTHRIEQAKQMLDRDPETIAEVAYAVGFTTHSSFTHSFREREGCTPSEYVDQQEA